MGDNITLNTKEVRRSVVLINIDRGLLTAAQAAEVLGISMRQVRRILAAYRQEGAAGLAHGNRGRCSVQAIEPRIRQQVLAFARTTYAGCNDHHLSELLAEREGLTLSRSSIRRILRADGLASPRKRRPPKHRGRRERYPQEGMLLQIDASRHAWLEDRGPMLSLLGAIDDATNTVPAALFRAQEDAHGYFLLVERIVRARGRPLAIYRDRHGIFERAGHEPQTLEEQLAGRSAPTQFGRVVEELAIGSIGARSPQAKGRIERLWGTFQDRLVAELRIAGATTLEEANRVLDAFVPRYNARFAVPATEPGSAYRPIAVGCDLQRVFSFRYLRMVGGDNTVRLGAHVVQLAAGPRQRSYAHARVEVREHLDGSLQIWYQGTRIAATPAPDDAPTLRARNATRGRSDQAETAVATKAREPNLVSPDLPEPATVVASELVRRPKLPLRPAANHPWREPVKRTMVTNS